MGKSRGVVTETGMEYEGEDCRNKEEKKEKNKNGKTASGSIPVKESQERRKC